MKQHHVWTWPIAGYLFLGGLGAGMSIVCAVADLFFGKGELLGLAPLGALLCLCLGSGLLIFELGRPLQFWRVFSTQRAVLTFGAWMVILLVVFDALYFSFFSGWFPWSAAAGARAVVAVIALLLGLGVLLYTGIELSSMKARVLWNTPALPVLFALSGILTGVAGDYLVCGLWPYGGPAADAEALAGILRPLMAGLAVATVVSLLLYVLMMYTSSNPTGRTAATRWLRGSYALPFWLGAVAAGLVLPLLLLILGGMAAALGALLFIVGGVFLRFLTVYSDDRRELAGERERLLKLPHGDEPFLKSNWG
ncbi:MAG: polysulfide reductase NrfD [Coriobacteriales bacterium]|jgi:formate-dependent nitrite reductase membrane component NrfD|nr:polysulfide reductase NrfD [Coriobacteriales bacterium]